MSAAEGNIRSVHPATSVQAALDMAARGLSATEIGRVLDCPRSTVRAWLTPTARSADGRDATCCSGCGAVHLTAETEPAAYAYLLGLYLGDGCISAHARGVFRLRITLDTRHPGIIQECRAALSAVAPRNKISVRLRSGGFETSKPDSNVEISVYAKWWPCALPQHGIGRKHERPIVLQDWQERLVDQHPRSPAARADPLRRMPLRQHRHELAISAVQLQQPVGGHPADLLRRLRSTRSSLDPGATHGLRVPEGRCRATGRVCRAKAMMARGVPVAGCWTRPWSTPAEAERLAA